MCTGITAGGQLGATAHTDGVPRRRGPWFHRTAAGHFMPLRHYDNRRTTTLTVFPTDAQTLQRHWRTLAERTTTPNKNVAKPHLGQVEQSSTSTGTGSTTHPPSARARQTPTAQTLAHTSTDEPDATARATVSREICRAIARRDKPSLPYGNQLSAVSTLIAHPIVARWPIFK